MPFFENSITFVFLADFLMSKNKYNNRKFEKMQVLKYQYFNENFNVYQLFATFCNFKDLVVGIFGVSLGDLVYMGGGGVRR